jgi:hypothetical protein
MKGEGMTRLLVFLVALALVGGGTLIDATAPKAADSPFVDTFAVSWADDGSLVVEITGADPAGTITVAWLYVATDGSQGTSGSVVGPFARADGTATVRVGGRHFPGDRSKYMVIAYQTAAAEGAVSELTLDRPSPPPR